MKKMNHRLKYLMFMYDPALGIAISNKRKINVQTLVKKMNSNFNISPHWIILNPSD